MSGNASVDPRMSIVDDLVSGARSVPDDASTAYDAAVRAATARRDAVFGTPEIAAGAIGPPTPTKSGLAGVDPMALATGAVGGPAAPIVALTAHGVALGKKHEDKRPPAAPVPTAAEPPAHAGIQGTALPVIVPGDMQGGVRQTSPGGMRVDQMHAQVRDGKPVADEMRSGAVDAANTQIGATYTEEAANKTLRDQTANAILVQQQAQEQANIDHAANAAKRDAELSRRLAEIEHLNDTANAEVDPNRYWKDRGAFAQVLGAIASAMGAYSASILGTRNMVSDSIEHAIDRDVAAQMANQKHAGQKAAQATSLYQMYEDKYRNTDAAIEATKMGLYKNVLLQVDKYRNEHEAAVDPARAEQLRGQILERYGESQQKMLDHMSPDVVRSITQNYHPPTYAGSGSSDAFAKKHASQHTVVLPASAATGGKALTVHIPDEKQYRSIADKAQAVGELHDINERALVAMNTIKNLARNPGWRQSVEAKNAYDTLERLGQDKTSLYSTERGQGVLRDGEYARSINKDVNFKTFNPLGDTPSLLRQENEGLSSALKANVKANNGLIVQEAMVRGQDGVLQRVMIPTGEDYAADPVKAPLRPVRK